MDLRGVGVNHHALSDFRVANVEFLDRLLTGGVAALLASEAVRMTRVAQDGARVRANAGASSFRGRPKLERFLAEAQEQVAALKQELDADPGVSSPPPNVWRASARNARGRRSANCKRLKPTA